jgi:outer membrane protein assembly factor BamB/tetratricopeptide (TPR) repeat protein
MTSLRGNLGTVDLAHILQMLQMNQREGTLYISGKDGRKAIYFAPDGVSTLNRSRNRNGSLGRILVRQGLINEEQLADAIRHQNAGSGRLIGQVLVEQGLARREDIDAALQVQIEEEIYDLFITRDAHFEFVEGPVPAEFVGDVNRIAINVNSVIMEAAQRIDEWEWIREVVPDLREIYRYTGRNVELEDPIFQGPAAGRVLADIDGRRDVDGLIDSSCAGRFDVCKVIALLLQGGALEPVPPDVLRREAEAAIAAGDTHATIKFLSRLVELRAESPDVHQRLAEAYESERELERAAFHYRVYAEIRVDAGDSLEAFLIYRRVVEILPTDLGAADRMVAIFSMGANGLEEHARQVLQTGKVLADVYVDLGRTSRAIQVLHRVVSMSPDDPDLRSRLIDVYLSAGMTGEAVAEYEALAETALAVDDMARAERILRKIITIDASRTDVLRKLNQVISRRTRRRRSVRNSVVAAGLVALLCAAGYFGLQIWLEHRAAQDRSHAQSAARVAELRDRHAGLNGELSASVKMLASSRSDDDALIAALEESRNARAELESRTGKAVGGLMEVVQEHAGSPAAEEANEVADGLREQLREMRRLEAEAVKHLAASAQKKYTEARGQVETGAPSREQYAAFDRAMHLGALCSEWLAGPDGTECQAFHKSLGETLAAFDATVERVRKLTEEGEHDEAFAAAVAMLHEYPPPDLAAELPFPVAIRSRPADARIVVNGTDTGLRTPATVLLPLRSDCEVVLSSDGFAPTPLPMPRIDETDPKRIEPLLPRVLESGLRRSTRFVSPPLKGRLEAPVRPVDGVALVPTRGDECAVLDLETGEPTRSLGLRNPNGAIAQPAIVNGVVAIPTVDGRVYFHDLVRRSLVGSYVAPGELRHDPVVHDDGIVLTVDSGHLVCVDVTSQRERWRYPEVGRPPLAHPAVGAPRLVGDQIHHVTADGLLTVVDARTGAQLREARLSMHSRTATVRNRVLMHDGALFATTSDGYLMRADVRSGAAVWSTPLEMRDTYAPLLSGDHLVVVGESGHILVIRASDGRVAARHDLEADVVVAPVIDRELLVVPVEQGVLRALSVGQNEISRVWEYATRDTDDDAVEITTRPVVRDAVVLFGAADGRVRAVLR